MKENALSLLHLNKIIKDTLHDSLSPSYWVIGEISEISVNATGHCYLELVEKNPDTDLLISRARATIWASVYRMVEPYFRTTTGTNLKTGMKVLVRVSVEYHELYGLSLNIKDIDPGYTIGEMALKKQETINRLTAEGVIHMNKELELPLLPKRIAIISSKTAAGYGDFMDQLHHNSFRYKFHTKLFPAFMQGEEAETSITNALEQIFQHEDKFDVVVIIRGGGAQADLSCFDSYWLAYHVTQFPLPVLTGIGHEQDESVTDLVAHTKLKTPTAVAEFLVARFQEAEDRLTETEEAIIEYLTDIIHKEKEKLFRLGINLKPLIIEKLSVHSNKLDILKNAIIYQIRHFLYDRRKKLESGKDRLGIKVHEYFLLKKNVIEIKSKEFWFLLGGFISETRHKLTNLTDKSRYLDPYNILKRGYSITLFEGRPLKDSKDTVKDDLIETILHKGKIKSRIK